MDKAAERKLRRAAKQTIVKNSRTMLTPHEQKVIKLYREKGLTITAISRNIGRTRGAIQNVLADPALYLKKYRIWKAVST